MSDKPKTVAQEELDKLRMGNKRKEGEISSFGKMIDQDSMIVVRMECILDQLIGPEGSNERVLFEIKWEKKVRDFYDNVLRALNLEKLRINSGVGIVVPGHNGRPVGTK